MVDGCPTCERRARETAAGARDRRATFRNNGGVTYMDNLWVVRSASADGVSVNTDVALTEEVANMLIAVAGGDGNKWKARFWHAGNIWASEHELEEQAFLNRRGQNVPALGLAPDVRARIDEEVARDQARLGQDRPWARQ